MGEKGGGGCCWGCVEGREWDVRLCDDMNVDEFGGCCEDFRRVGGF